MKIELITMHRVNNMGAFLQTLATQIILEKKGVQVEILDYLCFAQRKKTIIFGWRYRDGIKNKIKWICSNLVFAGYDVMKYKVFHKAQEEYLNISKQRYVGVHQLKINHPIADVYLIGSDQMWNYKINMGIDRVFLLDFLDNGERRACLSTSLGLNQIGEKYKSIMLRSLLRFDLISVRENITANELRKSGIACEHVVDPTLLLNKDEWKNITKSSQIHIGQNKYLLIYAVGYNKYLIKYAKEIAKQKDLKIYSVAREIVKNRCVDKEFRFITPFDFVKLILNASYVITDSFHGTIFSINFGVDFMVRANLSEDVRIRDVIEQFSLYEHVLNEKENLHIARLRNLDMELAKCRKQGYRFIDEIVKLKDKGKYEV